MIYYISYYVYYIRKISVLLMQGAYKPIYNGQTILQFCKKILDTRKVSAATSRAAFHPSALMYGHIPLEHLVILKSVWADITDLQFGEVLLKLFKAHP